MEQVFLNLLDNAVKFTPPGGKISYSGQIGKSLMCVLRSRITGSGSPLNIFPVYLNVFTGLTNARSREAGGTGLGLAIVRQIVSAHQGKIEVESTTDVGSTFRIFLPCQI